MDSTEIQDRLAAVEDRLEQEEVTVFTVSSQPHEAFIVRDQSLEEFAERGLELGASEFYLLENEIEGGEIDLGGVCFFYEGRAHAAYLRSETGTSGGQERSEGTGWNSSFGLTREESEEETQRKEELADELLTEYEEYLEEDERFEIENRLERMRLRHLLRLRERVEQEASVDPELEKELARTVYEQEEFNQQFNQTDTEMLLDQIDVQFDPQQVRIDEIHTRAKSLLKINR